MLLVEPVIFFSYCTLGWFARSELSGFWLGSKMVLLWQQSGMTCHAASVDMMTFFLINVLLFYISVGLLWWF